MLCMTTLNCYYMSAAVLCVVIIYNSVTLSLISFIFNSIYHFGRSEVQRVHRAGFPSETLRLPV